MPLTINTNMAASRASYFLSKNNDALQKSLDRLSSGRKITQPADDAGGLCGFHEDGGSIIYAVLPTTSRMLFPSSKYRMEFWTLPGKL